MERNKKQKEDLLKAMWNKKNPNPDSETFWESLMNIFNDYEKELGKPFIVNRFLAKQPYDGMPHKVGDIIEIPNSDWVYSDGTLCGSEYFRQYPYYFEELAT